MNEFSRFVFLACFGTATCAAVALGSPVTAASDPTPLPAATPTAAVTASPRPSINSHWDFVDDDSFPIELRSVANIVDSAGSYVVVTATINGKSGHFLLDTGAGITVLTDQFVDGLELQPFARGSLTGIAGNTITTTRAIVKDLGLGRSVLHDVPVQIASGDNATLGKHLDGALGYDVFANAIVEVDLSTQRMRVFDPVRFEPTVAKNSYIFDVDLASRQPRIGGTISGVPIHPILDSGNDLLLSLSDSIRDHNAVVSFHVNTLHFRGVDGETTGDCGRVNRVSFGAINYDGPIVCFLSGPVFGKDGGIVGFDFLRHFDWTIDYPDKKFVLTPNGL